MFYPVPATILQGYGLVKQDYRHIVMSRYNTATEMFICFECLYGGFKIDLLSAERWSVLESYSVETLIVVTDVRPLDMMLPRLLTCVGAAKHLLGVRWPLVFTPWQLRSALIKRGMADKFDRNNLTHLEAEENAVR